MRVTRLTCLVTSCLFALTGLGGGTAYGSTPATVVHLNQVQVVSAARLARGIAIRAGKTRTFLVRGGIFLKVSSDSGSPSVTDSHCPGCPPEILNHRYEVTACSGLPLIGCQVWHETLKERFYYEASANKRGNFAPRKVFHSTDGYAPSYIDCYDHGGIGDSVSVDGCLWDGPNPAYRKHRQHITAVVQYQTCAGSKVGPVCNHREIRLADYPDGHVEVST